LVITADVALEFLRRDSDSGTLHLDAAVVGRASASPQVPLGTLDTVFDLKYSPRRFLVSSDITPSTKANGAKTSPGH
jgi:hypothetical protein